MTHENTDWGKSVTAVVIREAKVLLARHSYGPGNGLLIVPGGYVEKGESPEDAVCREFMEETGVTIAPESIIGIRCGQKDWYIAFSARYVCGEARSDGDENSEVVWMDIEEALARPDVPGLTKRLIQCAAGNKGLARLPYEGGSPESVLYGAE